MQFVLHLARIGVTTQFKANYISELQTHRAGRWKSRAYMTHVGEAEGGADVVSAALAKTM